MALSCRDDKTIQTINCTKNVCIWNIKKILTENKQRWCWYNTR